MAESLPEKVRLLRVTSRVMDFSWRPVALVSLLGTVSYLALLPLVMILYGTFRDGPPGVAAAFTLDNYIRAYGRVEFLTLTLNTVLFALCAAMVSFLAGGFLAWVSERTNTPLKGVIRALVIFPFVIPGILTTVSWVLLLSPKIGIINAFFTDVVGLSAAPFNIYSFWGMVWTDGIDHITLPFFLMSAGFRSMDPNLEEAAQVSGSSTLRTLWHINVKLMFPTILATWLLLFIRGIESFEAPAVIGIPAGIKVYATQIFMALREYPPDYNLAGTYAVFYLVVAVFGLGIYLQATRASERYATITGKAYRPRTLDLGRWRYATLGVSLLILCFAVLLPILTVAWASLLPYYTRPSRQILSALTLGNYAEIFRIDMIYRAFANNLITGLSSATIAVLLGAAISWVVIRTDFYWRNLLDILAFTPLAFPGVVLGLALVWMYLTLPIPLYGTLWILVVGYVTKYIPIALRACHASLLQVHRELEEASDIAGASWGRTFFRIVLPLILPGLMAGWFYVLTLTFKVLALPILLSHVGTEVFPTVIYTLYEGGHFHTLSALGILLIVILTVVAGLSRLFSGRFGVQEG